MRCKLGGYLTDEFHPTIIQSLLEVNFRYYVHWI